MLKIIGGVLAILFTLGLAIWAIMTLSKPTVVAQTSSGASGAVQVDGLGALNFSNF